MKHLNRGMEDYLRMRIFTFLFKLAVPVRRNVHSGHGHLVCLDYKIRSVIIKKLEMGLSNKKPKVNS